MQKRLLAKNDLTLVKTMEIAQSMEAADQNAQKLKFKGKRAELASQQDFTGTNK